MPSYSQYFFLVDLSAGQLKPGGRFTIGEQQFRTNAIVKGQGKIKLERGGIVDDNLDSDVTLYLEADVDHPLIPEEERKVKLKYTGKIRDLKKDLSRFIELYKLHMSNSQLRYDARRRQLEKLLWKSTGVRP